MNDQDIFKRSLCCLTTHLHPEWGDRTALDVFNRLLAKNVRPDNWTANTHLDIQLSQVSSRLEQWTTGALAKLTRAHPSQVGKDCDCPIVIVEYAGKQRLLDGNHRINRWVFTNDTRLHDVHIHNIAVIGQFVELPAVTNNA